MSAKSFLAKCLLDVAICRDGGRRSVSGRGDRLGDGVLPDIADGVEAISGRFHPAIGRHMARVAQVYQIPQDRRVWL